MAYASANAACKTSEEAKDRLQKQQQQQSQQGQKQVEAAQHQVQQDQNAKDQAQVKYFAAVRQLAQACQSALPQPGQKQQGGHPGQQAMQQQGQMRR